MLRVDRTNFSRLRWLLVVSKGTTFRSVSIPGMYTAIEIKALVLFNKAISDCHKGVRRIFW